MRLGQFFRVASGCFLACVGLIALSPKLNLGKIASASSSDKAILGVEHLKPGMKGYGLTVFSGTKPEKFDAEIIDVIKGFRPKQDLILIHTDHPRLQAAKVVAGMSGSPIYIGDKLIGAYAYGWGYGTEPVAGVTPIENMLQLLERPVSPFFQGWKVFGARAKGSAGTTNSTATLDVAASKNRRAYSPESFDLDRQLTEASTRIASVHSGSADASSPAVMLKTPLSVAGLSRDAQGLSDEFLSKLGFDAQVAGGNQSSAEDTSNVPTHYEAGGAVGVQLIRGDISQQGLGTVTWVSGNKVLGFGHPMMNSGATLLPTAIGRVHWFLASGFRSFKIGAPARPLGALVMDRQAAILVDEQAVAPVIPLRLTMTGIPGLGRSDYQVEIAHARELSPSLVAVVIGNAISEASNEISDITWELHSTIKIAGEPAVDVTDIGLAIGGMPEPGEIARTNLVQAVGAILNNPWVDAHVESITAKLVVKHSRDVERIRSVRLLTPEVKPGESVSLEVLTEGYELAARRVRLSFVVPKDYAGTEITAFLVPGYAAKKPRGEATNLSQLMKLLRRGEFDERSLVIAYQTGSGIAYRGAVSSNLSPGALQGVSAASRDLGLSEVPMLKFHEYPMKSFISGKERFSIKILPLTK